MTYGRKKCVSNAAQAVAPPTTKQKVMPHAEFIDRIRKTLYYGGDALAEEMEVSRPFAEYASELFSEPHKGHSLNRLNFVTAGGVHATTPCSLIMALIYLDRLNVSDPGYVRRITPQELFIVSMMISTKFYAGHDEDIYLSDWADDGNMTEERLKQLEIEFLCAIDWNIYISNEQFFSKLHSIEKSLARREGLRRGWLTYSELMQMLPSFTLVKFLLNNITVMAVSYAASVMTIAGAFFLASQIPGNVLHRKAPVKNITEAVATPVGVAEIPIDSSTNAQTRLNCTHDHGAVTTVSHDSNNKRNASCDALNVELELLKLERQYREEAQRDALRKRNHEIDSATRLMLPDAVQHMKSHNNNNKQKELPRIRSANDMQRNWLALKAEYSEPLMFNGQQQHGIPLTQQPYHQHQRQQEVYASSLPGLSDCFWHLSNCTTTLFWHLFADAAQQSVMRAPLLWLKFI